MVKNPFENEVFVENLVGTVENRYTARAVENSKSKEKALGLGRAKIARPIVQFSEFAVFCAQGLTGE